MVMKQQQRESPVAGGVEDERGRRGERETVGYATRTQRETERKRKKRERCGRIKSKHACLLRTLDSFTRPTSATHTSNHPTPIHLVHLLTYSTIHSFIPSFVRSLTRPSVQPSSLFLSHPWTGRHEWPVVVGEEGAYSLTVSLTVLDSQYVHMSIPYAGI